MQTETVQSPRQTITTDIIYYYHNDHLGTPLFISDESGKEVWRREQTPFGEDTLQRGTITENLRFPGKYWDGEKENCYNFRRDIYYPNLGRYGQADPIGQNGGIDIYLYAKNNPLKFIDPSGFRCFKPKDIIEIIKTCIDCKNAMEAKSEDAAFNLCFSKCAPAIRDRYPSTFSDTYTCLCIDAWRELHPGYSPGMNAGGCP